MGKRIIRALDGLLNGVILVICAVCLLVSGYSLLDNYYLYKNASDDTLLAYRPPQPTPTDAATPEADDDAPVAEAPTEIRFISEKQAGWLQVYDTPIDYPVMRGEDNFEYLNLDPYGEFQLSGSIFMDYQNDRDMADDYIVIYGHHMGFNSMFGSLDPFVEEDYFDAHRSGRIVTRNGEYALELFAVTEGDGNDQTLFNPKGTTVGQVIDYLKDNAMIYTECDPNEKVVALTTCWGDTYTSRLLVFGTLRPVDDGRAGEEHAQEA